MSYINQKVGECIAEILIGEYSTQNAARLKMAALKAGQGVLPLNRDTLSKETLGHLEIVNDLVGQVDDPEAFVQVQEHLTAYLMCSQCDEGRRSVQR
jgi:hypothetical protein